MSALRLLLGGGAASLQWRALPAGRCESIATPHADKLPAVEHQKSTKLFHCAAATLPYAVQLRLALGRIVCHRTAAGHDLVPFLCIPPLSALASVLELIAGTRACAACGSDALQLSMRQQLQESGFTRALPQLLHAGTALLGPAEAAGAQPWHTDTARLGP